MTEKEIIEQLCRSKQEEFKLLGYDSITTEDIWQCVSFPYKEGLPPLHRLVNDILSLKASRFMNWMTNRLYRDDW